MQNVTLTILGWVLPILLGPLVYMAARELLNISSKIDDLPPALKRVAVVLLGTLVSAGFGALGVTIPVECSVLADASRAATASVQSCAEILTTKVPMQGVTAALAAMVMHKLKKSNPRS